MEDNNDGREGEVRCECPGVREGVEGVGGLFRGERSHREEKSEGSNMDEGN